MRGCLKPVFLQTAGDNPLTSCEFYLLSVASFFVIYLWGEEQRERERERERERIPSRLCTIITDPEAGPDLTAHLRS